jgi:hypothetical protein
MEPVDPLAVALLSLRILGEVCTLEEWYEGFEVFQGNEISMKLDFTVA